MPELVMEPEEEIASERFEARKHCPEDILKEALKQQKESGWYRREPITDPYSTKVRIGGAIVVFTASILFLSVFPACGNSDACGGVVGVFAFFGTCFFLVWRKPAKQKPHLFVRM
jgi:hypothetical protein